MHQIIRHIHLRGKRFFFFVCVFHFVFILIVELLIFCYWIVFRCERTTHTHALWVCGLVWREWVCVWESLYMFETIYIIIFIFVYCCCFFVCLLPLRWKMNGSKASDKRTRIFIEFVNGASNCIGAYNKSRWGIASIALWQRNDEAETMNRNETEEEKMKKTKTNNKPFCYCICDWYVWHIAISRSDAPHTPTIEHTLTHERMMTVHHAQCARSLSLFPFMHHFVQ